MNAETFGEQVRRLRQKKKYSQKYLATLIDYNPKSLSKVERGLLLAPQKIVEPLAQQLDADHKKFMIKYLSEKIYYEIKKSDYAQEVIQQVEKRLEKEGKGTSKPKKRKDIIQEIKDFFRNQPIEKAWLFGSFARKTESIDSDIDILIQFVQPNKITLFDLIDIQQTLVERTGREIDLVEEGRELKHIKKSIDQDKVLIYAR